MNDTIVDKNDDNDMDTSQSSDPPGEFVDIYANDNNKNIVHHNSLVYGRFPTEFEPILRLKVNETVNYYIPFLITIPYIYHFDIDQNTTISLDKIDIEIESKAITETNNGLAINVENKDNDMEIDLFVKETRPIKNANTNSVVINVGVKDKSKICSKGTVNVNDMIVDKMMIMT